MFVIATSTYWYQILFRFNHHGVSKTFKVTYRCCYGFQRGSGFNPGCTKIVDLKPLLDTIDAVDAKEFKEMVVSNELEEKCKKENLTVFVPSDLALNEFTEKMSDMNRVRRRRQIEKNAVSSKELVLNHMTKGYIDLNDISNEQILVR